VKVKGHGKSNGHFNVDMGERNFPGFTARLSDKSRVKVKWLYWLEAVA
jgi:hypothetical protein